MKSIAGSIVVLAGALIMGLASEEISEDPVITISSLVLMLLGLLVVATGNMRESANKTN